ncbi:MAG: TolC family protein [Glaciecola sp.]
MQLSTFSKAAKEIIITGIAALMLFAVAAAHDASANTVINDGTQAHTTALTEKMRLVTQLEADVLAARKVLALSHRQFEQGAISASDMFVISVKYQEIESVMVSARASLLVALANYKDTHSETLQTVNQVYATTK